MVTRKLENLPTPAESTMSLGTEPRNSLEREVLFHCAGDEGVSKEIRKTARWKRRRTPQDCERANESGPEANRVSELPV